MLDAVMVEGSIASMNVMLMSVFGETPVAEFAGDVEMLVGGASSRVLNVQLKAEASALPATSFAPVVMVAVMFAGLGSAPVGVSVARLVAASQVTTPGTAAPCVTRNVHGVAVVVARAIVS